MPYRTAIITQKKSLYAWTCNDVDAYNRWYNIPVITDRKPAPGLVFRREAHTFDTTTSILLVQDGPGLLWGATSALRASQSSKRRINNLKCCCTYGLRQLDWMAALSAKHWRGAALCRHHVVHVLCSHFSEAFQTRARYGTCYHRK